MVLRSPSQVQGVVWQVVEIGIGRYVLVVRNERTALCSANDKQAQESGQNHETPLGFHVHLHVLSCGKLIVCFKLETWMHAYVCHQFLRKAS